MPLGFIGNSLSRRINALETNFDSGYVKTPVMGSSVGLGGTGAPVYVPTTFLVKAAVGNLALEYDLKDAAHIHDFGDNIYAGEMKISIPGTGVGFYVEYHQLDPSGLWDLSFNWYERG
jgi:hypothetical protein